MSTYDLTGAGLTAYNGSWADSGATFEGHKLWTLNGANPYGVSGIPTCWNEPTEDGGNLNAHLGISDGSNNIASFTTDYILNFPDSDGANSGELNNGMPVGKSAYATTGHAPPPTVTLHVDIQPSPGTHDIYGWAGDSITYANTPTIQEIATRISNGESAARGVDNSGPVNAAIAGSKSTQWAHGTANYNAAVAAWNAGYVNVVQVMLGTNDAFQGTSAQDYKTALQSFIDGVLTDCPAVQTIIVSESPFSASINSQEDALLQTYLPLLDQLTVARGQILVIHGVYDYFKNNQSLLGPDGTHPTDAGSHALGTFWANNSPMAVPIEPVNTDGNSNPTSWLTVTAQYQRQTPLNLAGNGLGTRLQAQVVLTWLNPSDIGGIVIERRTHGQTAITVVATLGPVGSPGVVPQTYTDTTVTNGVTYDYRLTATP